MEALLNLTLLILLIGSLSIFVDRRLQAHKRAEIAAAAAAKEQNHVPTEASATSTSTFVSGLSSKLQQFRQSNPLARPPAVTVEQFRHWSAKAFTTGKAEDQLVQRWLASLSDEGMAAFIKQLGHFCTDMNTQLSWLTEGKLKMTPDLQENVTTMVRHYCRACHQAALSQSDIYVFEALDTFVHYPASNRGQAFGQKLFTQLLDAELIDVNVSEHLLASNQERRQQAVNAIFAAAARDNSRFNQILKRVVLELVQPDYSAADLSSTPVAHTNGKPQPATHSAT